MPLTIVGTVPYEDFPLTRAEAHLRNGRVVLGEESVPVARGTSGLIAAACMASRTLGMPNPRALVAGDIGVGHGSRGIYRLLVERFPESSSEVMVFHYLQPDVDWHNRILMRIEDLSERPLLVADAGYMYVAKMSGFGSAYDLFTPDAGEMAFLADESAPHPFYTRGFLLQEDNNVQELIRRAYEHDNAARYLLVKGRSDLIACADGLISEISEPCVETMEPIGGTGDTLTGVVAALIASGKSIPEAAELGATINRVLGSLANPTPAWSIADLLAYLPEAMQALPVRISQEDNAFRTDAM